MAVARRERLTAGNYLARGKNVRAESYNAEGEREREKSRDYREFRDF